MKGLRSLKRNCRDQSSTEKTIPTRSAKSGKIPTMAALKTRRKKKTGNLEGRWQTRKTITTRLPRRMKQTEGMEQTWQCG